MPNFRLHVLAAVALAPLIAVSLAVLSVPASATTVPPDIQQRVITVFGESLVLPDTAMWRFDNYVPFPGGGNVACGAVNYQDSTKAYIGWRAFFAVVRGPTITTKGILPRYPTQDPAGGIEYDYKLLCHVTTGPGL